MKYRGQWQGLLAPSRLKISQSGPILTAILASLPDSYRKNPAQTLVEIELKISAGKIVDIHGQPYSIADRVQLGQEIFIFRSPADSTATVADLRVLWQGAVAMIVDKPAGISTIPRGRYIARSVVYQARKQFNNPQIVAAHRLDKLTSGCLLLVTDPRYRSVYQLLFEKRQVYKRYLALTKIPENSPYQIGREYCWTLAMRKKSNSLQVQTASLRSCEKPIRDGGRQFPKEKEESENPVGNWHYTETRAWLRGEKNGCWQWELEPYTGFTHQLRAALSYHEVPILGDPLYPNISAIMAEDAAQAKLALCAWKLALTDPIVGQKVAVESEFAANIRENNDFYLQSR